MARLNMFHDPVPTLESITAPVLALFGGADRNVVPGQNVPLLAAALERAANTDATMIVVPNANHGPRLADDADAPLHRQRGDPPEVWSSVRTFLERLGSKQTALYDAGMPAPDRDYDAIAARVSDDGPIEARMGAVVDALWEALHDRGVSWVGFYLDHPDEPDDRRLVLGCRRDRPACSPIGLHGVCGQALTAGATRVVRDVAELGERYIACDPLDRSEIVVPLTGADGVAWAVLDIDSYDVGAFDDLDDAGLRRVLAAAGLLSSAPAAPRRG